MSVYINASKAANIILNVVLDGNIKMRYAGKYTQNEKIYKESQIWHKEQNKTTTSSYTVITIILMTIFMVIINSVSKKYAFEQK